MKEELYIQKQVLLKQHALYVNGTLLFEGASDISALAFFQELYRFFEINYQRFFKMDMLSKTLFLASEALIRDSILLPKTENQHVALVFCNSHSSIYSDKQFQATIQSDAYFPSPSHFIYTLPNIALGEVAIRNKFMGENCTFITPELDAKLCVDYVSALFNRGIYSHIICGWVDYIDERGEANIYLVSKEKTNKVFNINILERDKELYAHICH